MQETDDLVSNGFWMSKKFRPYEPDQLRLLPPSLRDWLPKDHVIYFISDVVDSLDLSPILNSYEQELRGYPPYHPAMMLKVLLFCYSRGIYSSRQVSREVVEDVATRILAAENRPDFRTIAAFRRRHLGAMKDLFAQVLGLCKEAGLVKLGQVALDGTKIKANASKHKAMSYGRMVTEEERLEKEIHAMLQRAATIDNAEDREFGDKRGDELPEELVHRESRLAKIRAAKAALEAEARARDGIPNPDDDPPPDGGGGKKRRPRKRKPGEPEAKAQRNFTDPDSRIMRGSDKQFLQAYNAQVTVDAESQVILAEMVTNQAADSPHLVPMVETTCAAVGSEADEWSADAGYYSDANLTYLQDRQIEAFIPPEKVHHSEWRTATSPQGRPPKNLTPRDRMRRKLRTKRGRARYRLRQTSVEPVFGQIKGARGFRQFSLRGLSKVQGEWTLVCLTHNLLKLFGHHRKQELNQAA